MILAQGYRKALFMEGYLMITKILKTDVAIVGGGLAGMYSAISANQSGCKVTIICKGKVGQSGSSVIAQTVHRVAYENDSDMESYYNFLFESGKFLGNRKLLEVLVKEGSTVIRTLQAMGVIFNKGSEALPNGGKIHRFACEPRKGRLLTGPIFSHLSNMNINFLENTMVLDLITNDHGISGLICISKSEILILQAKAVILASGGLGRIYKETSNPVGITGDGLAMAHRAGALLTGLEFVQFYPYRLQWPTIIDLNPQIFNQGARFINEKGDRFMRDFPRGEQENRDILALEMFKQKEIFLDLSTMLEKDLRTYPPLYDLVLRGSSQKLKMQVTAHFAMGGIIIDTEARTNIAGLFASGECTGGLHGANRLAGSALVDCAVFGFRAGANAAKYALQKSEQTLSPYYVDLPTLGEDQIIPIINELRSAMWANAGIQRSEKMLNLCRSTIKDLIDRLMHIKPASYSQWYEARNMLETSLLVVDSALIRKESRGSHIRLDYPNENNQPQSSIVNRSSVILSDKRI